MNQVFRVPHIKGTGDYTVNTIPFQPFPFVTPGGTEDLNIYNDDRYGTMFDLPFPFCFYDSLFNKVSVSSNGLITFDYNLQACQPDMQAPYNVTNPIPFNSLAATCSGGANNYPRASIMGAFMDLDPRPGPTYPNVFSSPPDRKIEWRVEGTAPFRRFIVSFYKVGVWEQTTCGIQTPATFQIVIYESTAVIEIFIENKTCSANGGNGGRAILGIQDWTRTKARFAPGKNATVWTASQEGYRFTPSAAASRFVSCQVESLTGTLLSTGDTATTTAGLLDVSFPNFCPSANSGQYVIKTTYSACDNLGSQVVVRDTITVNRTTALNATATTTQTSCGISGSGTATVSVPAGLGTAPFTFAITPGTATLTGNSPQQFTGLAAGNYSILVTDAGGTCNSTVPVTITSNGTLTVTYGVVNPCPGGGSGTITVNPPNGTPPFLYSINGSVPSTNNVFVVPSAGVYLITTTDAAGCEKELDPVVVLAGTGSPIAGSATSTSTTCSGVNNGTVTINVTSGTGPFQYSIDGGVTWQSSNIFTGLGTGSYTGFIRSGTCTSPAIPASVTAGTGFTATSTSTTSSCSGASNGSLTVSPVGGSGPYTFTLGSSTQTGATSATFNNLASGNYNVLITDANGCQYTLNNASVNAGTGFTASHSSTNSSCFGAANGTITVTTGAGGIAPFTFTLGSTTQTGSANTTFTGLIAGIYSIQVTDAVGCQYTVSNATVTAGTAFTSTYTSNPASCSGASNGSITVTPGAGGIAPYSFVLGSNTLTGSTATFNNLSAGTHNVTITDAAGCQSLLNANVAAGPGFTASFTSSNASCTGAANGSITVTPGAGGTAPFTFALGANTQTGSSATFANLVPGSHSVLITDANGCQFTLNANVTASTGFTATYTSTNASCAGAANGSITVTPGAGGTAPFSFVMGANTQTGTTATFNNITPGNHNVLVTDANGCQFTVNATVNADAGFSAGYSSINSTCAAASNGSITVTPGAGSTGPYTFVLGSTTQTGPASTTFAGLTAGSYNVQVTDANGCQYTVGNAVVNAGPGFTASYTANNTSCQGASNGSLTVTPGTGGTGPYTFVLGAVTQTASSNTTFNGLAAGSHSISITDASGCQYQLAGAVVPDGPLLSVPLNINNTSCPGVNDGSVIAAPLNGSGPYTFVLNGTTTQTGTAGTTFTGLPAGTHSMQVTDQNGCTVNLPAFDVSSGADISAIVTPVGTSCSGALNGSISIAATSGTGPYTFVLDNSISQTGNPNTSFSNLPAGSGYSIFVTDAIGCSGTFGNINVPQGSALQVNTDEVNTTCTGAANGQITVTPENGGGPYSFVLNGTVTQTGAISTTFTGLPANTYNIVVTDAAGCVTGPIPAVISAGPAITVNPSKTDANCFGSATGSIIASASANASAPVEFSLNNTTWQTNPNFSGLSANTYTVYVRDAVGCTNSATATVGQPTAVSVAPSAQDVSCNGLADGRLTIAASGGTPSYTYSLDNINFQTSNVFTVPAGSYTVYVRDANNCRTNSTNVVVNEPAVLSASALAGNATCDGGDNGTINVSPGGGTSPYQYALNGGTFQANPTLNAGPGTFDVTVRDSKGCTYQLNGIVVGLTNNLLLTPAADPPAICEGKSVQLQLNTNATQFAWTPSAGLSNSTMSNPVASPSATTTYSVTATLGRCTLTDDILVSVLPAPVPDAGIPGDICYGQSYQLQAIGDPSFIYSWSPSTYLSGMNGQTVTATPEKTITYSLTVTDNNGCSSLAPGTVSVNVTLPIKVTVYPADTVVTAGATIPLLAESAGTSYLWSPAIGLNNDTVANPVATASLIVGDYITYKVTTSTSAGCTGDGFVTVRVFKGPEIYVPTAFTPNGDGRNDLFFAFPVGIKELKYFRVFNRWGQLVFSTSAVGKGWDGKLAGIEQSNGVYIWSVEGITTDGQKVTKKGTVTLIR